MSRLFDRLAANEMALGVWLKGGPNWVSTIARAGFDFVRPDMMFSAMDWKELDHIHRAAQGVGLTTWVRVPANPWLGGTGQLQVTVDVQRAFSFGIEIVGASIASAEQVRACVEVARDWHRSGTGEYPSSNETFVAMSKKEEATAVFVPHIEAVTAVQEIDEILAIEGIRIVMLAMTDLSKALGHPFQYEHPEVWKALDSIVEKASKRGIAIAANMGYDYTTHERMSERVQRMYEHGVRICLMQGADNMLENFAKPLLNDIRGGTGEESQVTEVAQAFRDKTAVAGVGLTLGKFPDRTALSLAIDAFKIALDDAGLEREDVDGLITLSFGSDYDRFLEATGLNVRYAHQGWTHGRFISPTVQFAAMAVGMGMAKAVAIVNGKRGKAFGAPTDIEMWRQGLGPHGESPAYGALRPAFGAAISAQRYFHMYGGSNDDLGPICVAFRKHARLNPIAVRRDQMTLDDYRKSPWIVEPLRLFDCCQVNDGGSCIIITSAERAKNAKKPPVLISGMQGVHAGPEYHNLALPGLGVAQQKVYKYTPTSEDLYSYRMAGITHKDVDALITYDAFSPLVLFALERFGFCGPGEAREFVKDGRIELGGELPVNTSGGLLSEGHLSGWNLLIEAVRQARGECGERQVKDAQIVQYGCFLGESLIFKREQA